MNKRINLDMQIESFRVCAKAFPPVRRRAHRMRNSYSWTAWEEYTCLCSDREVATTLVSFSDPDHLSGSFLLDEHRNWPASGNVTNACSGYYAVSLAPYSSPAQITSIISSQIHGKPGKMPEGHLNASSWMKPADHHLNTVVYEGGGIRWIQ